MRALPVVLLFLSALLVMSPARGDTVDYTKSRIGFTFKQMNVPVEGRFAKFSAELAFDSAIPETSRATIEVDLGSIDTGSAEADTEAKRKPWFNVESFPKARFVSSSVKAIGQDRYQVSGTLTIKGRSQDLGVPVTLKREAGGTAFEGAFALPRLRFGIGEGPWADTETVADEVQVRFRIFVSGSEAASARRQN